MLLRYPDRDAAAKSADNVKVGRADLSSLPSQISTAEHVRESRCLSGILSWLLA
jgi:hypothetical protein